MTRLCRGVLFIVLLLAVCGCAREEKPALAGNPAPDFTLRNLAGQEVKLADLRGKVVLVNFWATWCPPCREEIPSMDRLNRAMAGKPFQMLAISIDEGGKEAVEAFFSKAGVALPTLLDPGQKTGKQYGITGVPETFIVDKKGVILKKVVGALDWSDPMVAGFLENAMKQ
jgi:peroxiredoxin